MSDKETNTETSTTSQTIVGEEVNFWDTYRLNRLIKKIPGYGQLSPPPNYRRTVDEVMAWRQLSQDEQKERIKMYRSIDKNELHCTQK